MLPAGPQNRSYTIHHNTHKYHKYSIAASTTCEMIETSHSKDLETDGNSKKRKGTAFEAHPAALAGERAAVVGLPLLNMLHPKGLMSFSACQCKQKIRKGDATR